MFRMTKVISNIKQAPSLTGEEEKGAEGIEDQITHSHLSGKPATCVMRELIISKWNKPATTVAIILDNRVEMGS